MSIVSILVLTEILSSASKLQKCHEIPLSADLDSSEQYITCYAMCDDIGKSTSTSNS